MKKCYLFLFLLGCITFSIAAAAVPLPDLGNPDSITVDKDKMFVTDRAAVSIYSLKDFKLIKTFGKSGEGPQEFKVLLPARLGLRIALLPNHILVNSIGKVSFFSREGEYIKEINVKSMVQEFKPLGKKFVGYGQEKVDKIFYLTINIYDADFGLEKEIYRKDWYAQVEKNFNPLYMAGGVKRRALYHTYDNKLFVEGDNGEIVVFDEPGKKLYTIAHEYDKVEITEEHKKIILKRFEKQANLFQMVKQRGKFPAHFPPRYFNVADGKVYVLTYKQNEGKSQFYIFDLKGKFLKKVMVPFAEIDFISPYPYTICNEKLYQLVDDEDTEEWQLRIADIK